MPTTLTPGDIAIIGIYTGGNSGGNTATSDGFAFVTLAPIDSGTDIYFTDNGWNNNPTGVATGSAGFRGVSFYAPATSSIQGPAGNEGLIKLTTGTNTIPAGTVIRTYDSICIITPK
jgi:hypothetical protein